ncbi:hypothetical protein [Lentimonas sp. CC10]|uniref:hypothetical protein n=1 Tax=Lentimonas sp. CC10 TaxID=2676095 RepID=UPI0013258C2C|nr:hypothetical protein [Lentimonas sp. CC10]CAA6679751.1 Unannotated [Lentimonas sp. CC4]CAA6683483.1 Unannotated [Lentimonas sp. CC6]CAA6695510.1 Unannotated [Lentimonas sp. CC19]CAA7071725.1 Unannotated [Lentimonas sp. CC11]CAA7171386.1 Unannotated [Lentimonas sp. CC21]CAA7182371.1 Unannotated [Lentimonas sp. CC8]
MPDFPNGSPAFFFPRVTQAFLPVLRDTGISACDSGNRQECLYHTRQAMPIMAGDKQGPIPDVS